MKRFDHLLKPQFAAFILALCAMPALLWLFQRTTEQLTYANQWLNHTYAVMNRIDDLQHDLELAESARRAYSIVHQESYVLPYYLVRKALPKTLAELSALTVDNELQTSKIRELKPLTAELMALIQHDISHQRYAQQQQLATMARAKQLIDESRTLFAQMQAEETRLLKARSKVSAQKMHNLQLLLALVSVMFIALLLFSFLTLYREIMQRRRTERSLVESQALAETTVRNLSLIGEMNDLLHAAQDRKEALQIVASFTERLIQSQLGIIYLYSEANGRFESRISWGAASSGHGNFHLDDCWALRRHELHALNRERHAIGCRHVPAPETVCTLCAPIIVQGESLGIIYLENPRTQPFSETEQRLLCQIALALANNRLRANLRSLSVRDPLTQLFNRRYMEESLAREIANADRQGQPLGMLMLDLDYFKHFNDSFGHEVGDFVLEIAKLLLSHTRTGDITCRYGGEEFVIIYLAAPSDALMHFADQLRTAIHGLQLQHEGRFLGTITASFGLAAYPRHAQTAEALLRAADLALYQAKANGRDRIEMAASA
ncbi:MAG TPA: diguanylate cyclase [Methylophilaceae bacterium]|nr:diguanylate cyclase [Methylophilaceae bacterium]